MRTIKNHKIKKTLTKVFLKTSKNQKGKKMFNLKEKLEFLEDGIDFPFYNDIPKLSIAEWMLVLISIILVLYINLISEIPQEWFSLSVFISALAVLVAAISTTPRGPIVTVLLISLPVKISSLETADKKYLGAPALSRVVA